MRRREWRWQCDGTALLAIATHSQRCHETENPTEPFKRAVATAVRSLAGEPELEVNFSAEPPALKGLKARLPAALAQSFAQRSRHRARPRAMPMRSACLSRRRGPRAVPPAIVRGGGGLRSRRTGARGSHRRARDERRRQQSRGAARTALQCTRPRQGARSMPKRRWPMRVGLMVREKLTGEAPPECARTAVDLWRPWIEERAGKDLAKLDGIAARPEGVRQAHAHHAATISNSAKTCRKIPKAKAPTSRASPSRNPGSRRRRAQESSSEVRARRRGDERVRQAKTAKKPPPKRRPRRPPSRPTARKPTKA